MPSQNYSNYSSGNKRIAKNTLVIYGQLLLRLILGLYTSRLALEALGVSDFGLYSVVAGVVGLFTFVSASLANTTIRFVNVERGKPDGDLNKVFNVCHVLHIVMAVLLLLLLEIGGIYYINHFLNIEPGREADAMFAFQVAIIVCCLGIVNVPFSSLFNATEKFLFTAVVAISIKVAQLILLFWLLTYEGNRIKAFALIESLTTLTSFMVYHYYCYCQWPNVVKWRFYNKSKLYKEILIFSFYNLLSTIAGYARGQGSMLLINYFFGTIINGAFAVAKILERNLYMFANNFQSAAEPQITQNYSSGNTERVFYLASRVGKYCIMMMLIAFFPLWAELDFILHVWLIKVPDEALIFCQMILLLVLVSVTDGGLSIVVNASGKVSKFKTIYSIITLLCIPIGYWVLKVGGPAYMVLVVFLIADIIWRIIQIFMMHCILQFPVLRYCREAYFPLIVVLLPIIICMMITSLIPIESPMWHIGHLLFILAVTICSSFCFGLKKNEREKVIVQILFRIKSHLIRS